MKKPDDDKTAMTPEEEDKNGAAQAGDGQGTVIRSEKKHSEGRDQNSADEKTLFKKPETSKPAGDSNETVIVARTKLPEGNETGNAIKPGSADVADLSAADKTRFVKPQPMKPGSKPVEKTRLQSPRRDPHKSTSKAQAESQAEADSHTILKNRFVLESVLGSGGMGVVYKARDLLKVEAQDRNPHVAIKVLGDEFKSHPEAFIALQRESRKTQSIAHPNIVNVHDFDRDGDTVFMTMEFLEGQPLDELIRQHKATSLPKDNIETIIEGMCAALIYAHRQNIIHADFKPGNIFVTNSGTAKVFDFGIARAVGQADKIGAQADDKTIFDAGNLGALTPAYASAEMLSGEEPDARDDIYALGCIAYELYTGVHPFNRMHADEARRKKLKPGKISDISKQQWLAIQKALAFRREDRVASVEEFWSLFTKKYTPGIGTWSALALVLVAVLAGLYQYLKPTIDVALLKDEARLELYMEEIDDLVATPTFLKTWEDRLWRRIRDVRKMPGSQDEWLARTGAAIYKLYIDQIAVAIEQEKLEQAQNLIANVEERYLQQDSSELEAQQVLLAAALKQLERKQLEREQLEREQRELEQQQLAQQQQAPSPTASTADRSKPKPKPKPDPTAARFAAALANVNKAMTCRTYLDMGNLRIAIDKLQSVSTGAYRKEQPKIAKTLAACIAKIGEASPKRAGEYKKSALRIFPSNAVISAIAIAPRDPCDQSLAGRGRSKRSMCRDDIPNLGTGPSLVVIPAKGQVKSFAIGKYEVSVAEINRFCGTSSSCNSQSVDERLPATGISTDTIRAYLQWLSNKTGKKYRLPTKAEWLHAAKAGNGTLSTNRTCYLDSRGIRKGGAPVHVSSGDTNRWGLVNHVGNASEWVLDRGGSFSAIGGSYDTPMQECNFTTSVQHTGNQHATAGFRVLRELSQ